MPNEKPTSRDSSLVTQPSVNFLTRVRSVVTRETQTLEATILDVGRIHYSTRNLFEA
jgi:hypothetical protein